ncbi:MAG: DUF4105 domain-containing protein [Pirellulaceae bacterium]
MKLGSRPIPPSHPYTAKHGGWWLLCAMLVCLTSGCKVVIPSNQRIWAPDQAKLPYAIFHAGGDEITLQNVRNCRYATENDYVVQHYDKTFKLSDVQSVDYVVVPFEETPNIAHTMLSFGLTDDRYLATSVEIRKEDHEEYSPWRGFFNQYELMYVIGDERDIINLSSNYYESDVYLYRTVASPEQSQKMLKDVLKRANKLAHKPEFYNTLTNNCTTNIVRHANQLAPNKIPFDMRVVLPGKSDEYAYELGLLDTTVPFEQLKQQAKINDLAAKHRYSPDFSKLIRSR